MGKRKKWYLTVSLLLIAMILLSACKGGVPDQNSPTSTTNTGQSQMTEVGTPRNETLIVDNLSGRIANPNQWNPYMPGTDTGGDGLHSLLYSHLWDIDTVKGQQFPALAEKPAEALNADYTKYRITLRKGIYWSDNVEFTADDVVFTANMILTHEQLPYNGQFKVLVKSVTKVDNYTIDIETPKSDPRLQQELGAYVWGSGFYIVPKHIWENEDPATFKDSKPIGLGAYTLNKVDPSGYWFLWEKRTDWQKTDVGMIAGEPKPKYVLIRFYGPEEKRVIAAIQHNLDVSMDISPESWDILRGKNQYAQAWYKDFPYADMDDPAARGITFNDSKPPYDKKEVRWALALAADITNTSLATYKGMLRASALAAAPTTLETKTYYKPLESWLQNFSLPDGYKPFDPTFAAQIADKLKKSGINNLPSNEQALKELFGIGWWKFDPKEASKLLEGVGFKKDASGKWLMPNGQPWQMTINAPANFEPESGRLAYAVADAWKKFGIDVNVQQMDAATFSSNESTGNFQAGSYWPLTSAFPDFYSSLQTLHKKYIVPTGKPAPGNRIRYSNDKISSIIDELAALPSNDSKVVEKSQEFLKTFVEEMPYIPMFGTSKFVPVDTYYWKGFPTNDNNYEGPWWWWSLFKYMMPKLEPTGRTS